MAQLVFILNDSLKGHLCKEVKIHEGNQLDPNIKPLVELLGHHYFHVCHGKLSIIVDLYIIEYFHKLFNK